jgi:hypothetical protein
MKAPIIFLMALLLIAAVNAEVIRNDQIVSTQTELDAGTLTMDRYNGYVTVALKMNHVGKKHQPINCTIIEARTADPKEQDVMITQKSLKRISEMHHFGKIYTNYDVVAARCTTDFGYIHAYSINTDRNLTGVFGENAYTRNLQELNTYCTPWTC